MKMRETTRKVIDELSRGKEPEAIVKAGLAKNVKQVHNVKHKYRRSIVHTKAHRARKNGNAEPRQISHDDKGNVTMSTDTFLRLLAQASARPLH